VSAGGFLPALLFFAPGKKRARGMPGVLEFHERAELLGGIKSQGRRTCPQLLILGSLIDGDFTLLERLHRGYKIGRLEGICQELFLAGREAADPDVGVIHPTPPSGMHPGPHNNEEHV
jgi:hypothetical protein